MAEDLRQIKGEYGDRLNFVMLNVDDPRWASQVSEFGASGVPQFTLLDAAQQPVETWVGKVPKPIFSNVFDRVLGAFAHHNLMSIGSSPLLHSASLS